MKKHARRVAPAFARKGLGRRQQAGTQARGLSEERYRLVFENSPVCLWEEDFSAVKELLDDLKREGVTDIEAYLADHPDTVRQCAALTTIVDVNRAALALHGAHSKEELLRGLSSVFTPDSLHAFRQELVCLWREGTQMTVDGVVKTLAGEPRSVTLGLAVCPGHERTLSRVLVSVVDVTDRRRGEAALRRLNRELRALSRCSEALIRADDERQLLVEICQIVCEAAGYRFAWVVYAEHDAAKTVRPVAYAGAEDGYLATVTLTWDDNERGRGPAGAAIRTGETVYVQDFATDPRMAPWRENALRREYRSGIGLPLKDRTGRPFGALLIYSAEIGAFTPDEIRLLEGLAGDLAYGIGALRMRANRERVESQLRRSEEKFAAAFHASPNLIAITRMSDGTMLEVNEAYTRILGYTREESVGRTTADLSIWVDPADRATFIETVNRTGEINDFETRLRRKDGSVVDCLDSARAIDFAGEKCVLSVVHDITERKRIENVLRKREGELREAQRVGRLGSWEWNAATDTIIWSQEYYRIFGFDPAQRPPGYVEHLKAYTPESAALLDAAVQRNMRTGEPYEVDLELAQPSGRTRWIVARSETVRDAEGRIVGLRGTAQDITERKTLEVDLRRSAAAIEQAAEAIVITDTAGVIQYVNPAFTRITGYGREEAVGQNPRLLNSGKHPAEFYRQLWETLANGEVWHGDFINRRKDGTLFQEEASISPVRDAGGKVAHYVAVKRDVTQEVALEARLRQAQKMEAIGRLAGGVAHDFNNLLSVVFGAGELALGRMEPTHPARGSVEQMLRAGEGAAKLTRQLLAFSRQQVLAPSVLDLRAVVSETAKMLARVIREDVELVLLSREEDSGRVRADPGQIEQILMNLAINARDAMPRGGRLTIETKTVELGSDFAASHPPTRPGRYVLLTVRDTGVGMSAEVQARLFEPFFTTKEPGRGTGLGLSTVYGIVKQSGGYVWVSSEVGVGTTFDIYLPSVDEPLAPAAQERPTPMTRGGETVLLIEDEPSLRSVLRETLEEHGYRVLVAGRGDEALQIASTCSGDIHLMLTDVIMPGLTGREVAAEMARSRPGIKVLFVSGYTQDAVIRQGALGPRAGYLSKPFTSAALLRKCRELLDEPEGDSTPRT